MLPWLDRAGRNLLRRVERSRAEEADARRRGPADVDDDRVGERGLLPCQPSAVSSIASPRVSGSCSMPSRFRSSGVMWYRFFSIGSGNS